MGIGMNGTLPWPMIRKDMSHFASTTSDINSLTMTPAEQATSSLLFNSPLRAQL